MLAPVLAALVVLRLYPIALALKDSFEGPHGASLANYRFIFSSSQFLHSLLVTLIFNVIVNPFQLAVALGLAVLLTRRVPGRNLWRALIFAPVAMPMPVSAVIWNEIFAQNGAANGLLKLLGLPAQGFLTSQHQALGSIIILASWIGVGYWMIFLIAGLQDIPTALYDAAAMDGTSVWQRFRYVTLPMLRRPLAFVLVADTVANLVLFAPVQILTSGGPLNATNLLMYSIYQEAFTDSAVNLADAETIILVLVSLIIVTLEFRILRSGE
jgi:multiple sugar transport system permease protein